MIRPQTLWQIVLAAIVLALLAAAYILFPDESPITVILPPVAGGALGVWLMWQFVHFVSERQQKRPPDA